MTLPDKRPHLELVAFAAWVNVPVDAIPASFLAPTCQHTMDAWKRVADAIAAALRQQAPDDALKIAATNLLADVRRRYPGEELRCEYMIALDAALKDDRQCP